MSFPMRLLSRIAGLAGLAIAVLLALGVLLLVFAGFVPAGARLAANAVASLASNEERTVTISPPQGLLTGRLRVAEITVADREGVYAGIGNLAVDWSPLALLTGTFRASLVSAETVSLSRKPLPSETEDTESGGFSLPVAVEVERISLPDIDLAEAVAGRAFSLAAQGSVSAASDSAELALSVNRKDVPEAKAEAEIVYLPADNRLTLEASLFEPQGGLIARLASLPGEPSVELRLTGEGPLSDWRGNLTGSADGETVLALEGRHQLSEASHRVTLTGGGTPSELLPPLLRPLFAGETRLDLAAVIDGTGRVDIESGRLQSAALDLDASGAYDPAGGENSLQARLTGVDGPVDFRLPLEGGEARALIDTVTLSLTGPTQAARLEASAALTSATLPQGELTGLNLTATGDGLDLAARSGRVLARLTVEASRFADENLARLVRAPLTLSLPLQLSPDAIAFENAELESASIGGTANGTYTLSQKSFAGNFRLFALPDVLPPALAEKFATTIAVEGDVSAAADGRLGLENLALRSDAVEAAGTLSLENGELQTALTGRLPDLGKWLADATGEAAFSLSANGPLAAPAFDARIEAADAVLAGRNLSTLAIFAEGTADPAAPQARLAASGSLDGQAIEAEADLVSTPQGPEIPALTLTAGPNRLNGNLRFTPDFRPASGAFAFTFPDISLLAALAGQQASGSLDGEAALTQADGRTGLTVRATGGVARDGASVDGLNLDLAMPDITAIALEGRLAATRAGTAAASVQNPVLTVTHAGNRTGFDLNGRFDGAPLTLQGALEQAGGALAIRLDGFSAAPRQIPLRLAAPNTIRVENGAARLADLRIATGSGAVTLNGTAGQTLALNAAIAALPASLVNAFAPDLAAEGTISGTVRVTGAASNPSVAYDLDWANAATSQTRAAGLAPLAVSAEGTYADNRVGLDTTVTGAAGLSLSGGGTVALDSNRALALAFRGRVPFAALQGQLSAQGISAEGGADIDLSIGGSVAAPAITGTVSVAGARLIDVRRNLMLNDLSGAIRFDGQQATIQNLSGRLGGGGTISASGTVGLAPGSGFPADITIRLNGATYADGTLFTASATGDLALRGPLLTAPVLSGGLTLRDTAITVPAKLPASLSEIDIRHRNAPAAVRAQTRDVTAGEEHGSTSTIGLDLRISAPSGIFVRGRGIDAELGGNLTIRGTAADPVVSGGFTMRRGRLSILNRRLDFSSGTITFGGGLIPVLNMEATTAVSATTITVTVAGVADDPTITFASSPALPQDEVIAQLIFGQSMSRLSALQIAQLADAVSQLAGGRSTSLFEALRSNLGVDDLDISTDESGQTRVSAGRYLNERTYLELEQGGTAGGKAIINLDVGRGVKLRGEAGADGSGAAGIFFEREY